MPTAHAEASCADVKVPYRRDLVEAFPLLPSGSVVGPSVRRRHAPEKGRVHTRAELLGNVCCGSGCGYDNNHVWYAALA